LQRAHTAGHEDTGPFFELALHTCAKLEISGFEEI